MTCKPDADSAPKGKCKLCWKRMKVKKEEGKDPTMWMNLDWEEGVYLGNSTDPTSKDETAISQCWVKLPVASEVVFSGGVALKPFSVAAVGLGLLLIVGVNLFGTSA